MSGRGYLLLLDCKVDLATGPVSESTEVGNDALSAANSGRPGASDSSRESELEPRHSSVRPFHLGNLRKISAPAMHPMTRRNGASPHRV
jgi:hypothetical protein